MKQRNNDNNPKYQVYWINKGLTENEANEQATYYRKSSTQRCPEYWMKHGYSYEDAIKKVSEIQSNCSKHNKGVKKTPEHREKIKQLQNSLNTLKYWIDKHGEYEGENKFKEFQENRKKYGALGHKKRLETNPNSYIESSIRRPEYWIKMGYTEKEAKLIVAKKQSRGLDFYIKKYGDEEGLERWKSRNEKWYNSFYNNGKNLDEINEKRRLNCHVGYYTNEVIKNIPRLNFYMITLMDNNKIIAKYGLTKHDNISKRWKVSLNYNLFIFKELDSTLAIELENKFHKKFKNSYTPTVIKTTECFEYTDDNLNTAFELLKEHMIFST